MWTNDEPLSVGLTLLTALLSGRLEQQRFWKLGGLRFLEVSVSGGGGFPSWLGRCHLLTVSLRGQGREEGPKCLSLLIRTLIPSWETCSHKAV